MKNTNAVALGKKSAKKRKKIGHNKKYYSELAKKRWNKLTENKVIA